MAKSTRIPPGRRQYLEAKRRYPDALLLFRMGDFYETFDEDARTMARVLNIALTKRDVGGGRKAPLAGIPYHALDTYLGRLVKAGLKIAICEQISDPAASKGVVDRAVVRIVTPGTVLEPGLLDEGRNNYLAALVVQDETAGLAFVDVTTSEFRGGQLPVADALDELSVLEPTEILVNEGARAILTEKAAGGPVIRDLPPGCMDTQLAGETLRRHFNSGTLEPFGLTDRPLAILAAGAVLGYLSDSQLGNLPQITTFTSLDSASHMVLDQRALRDLEVLEPVASGSDSPTLLSVFDRTRTPMGRRALRTWLVRPLVELGEIKARHDMVESLVNDGTLRGSLRGLLAQMPDLERLTNRARSYAASPRDLSSMATGLDQLPAIREALGGIIAFGEVVAGLEDCTDVVEAVHAALQDEPSPAAGDGGVIREGFDAELDEVRALAGDARGRIAQVETDLRESTGIKTLKVSYNKVFGYFIEVSRSNLDKVPADFERRQTLVNAERFITPGLKDLESRILTARDRISEIERSLFRRVTHEVAVRAEKIMRTAAAVAQIDVLSTFAEVAAVDGYVRPVMDGGDSIVIDGGRHPVVEKSLGAGKFVGNDLNLSSGERQLAIVTGPNMSGKSTYIRQAGLLVLMAQAGAFVPADRARFGITDRVFTRCNLSDDIARGRSTFLVEMEETATILHQATRRSLVILDEIGRGTSTYDGLAIARAVAEHIHSAPGLGCKTLFATHYHEMTALADSLPRAINLQVAVTEENGEVVFLHRILEGGADRSYGVYVGRLAGLPQPVITRAWELLAELEAGSAGGRANGAATVNGLQLPLMPPDGALREAIQGLNISEMTPLEAITKLYELQQETRDTPNTPKTPNTPNARDGG